MKIIFFVLLYGAMVCATYAQTTTYTVIKAEPAGKVTLKGKNITVGTTLKATDKVVISSPDGYIKVYNGKSSAYIKKSGEVGKVLEKPKPLLSITGTRGTIENKDDLIGVLNKSPLVIIDTLKLSMPKSLYVLEKWKNEPVGKFFYLTYQYDNKEEVRYLQVGENNSLVIDIGVFWVGKKFIEQGEGIHCKLFYSENEENNYPITDMKLRILRTDDIKAEIGAILNTHKQLDDSYQDTVGYIAYHIAQSYGEIELDHLKEWLNKTFGYK